VLKLFKFVYIEKMNFIIIIVIIIICIIIAFQKSHRMSGGGPEITFAEIEQLSPDTIYVHGTVASGKSFLTDKLRKLGYKEVHIDELVREEFKVWPKKIYLDDDGWTKDQEQLFTRIKREIDGHKKVVIDGYIAPLMWKKLYAYRPWDLFVYVEHRTLASYRIAIMKRALQDIEMGRRTLTSFWLNVDNEHVDIHDDSVLQTMVDRTAQHKWEKRDKDRKTILGDWDYRMYYTNLQ
jgi:hypothetical protein